MNRKDAADDIKEKCLPFARRDESNAPFAKKKIKEPALRKKG